MFTFISTLCLPSCTVLCALPVVKSHIGTNKFPADVSGIYILMTAADATLTGLCTSFCGYHSVVSVEDDGDDKDENDRRHRRWKRHVSRYLQMKYVLAADVTGCLEHCAPQR